MERSRSTMSVIIYEAWSLALSAVGSTGCKVFNTKITNLSATMLCYVYTCMYKIYIKVYTCVLACIYKRISLLTTTTTQQEITTQTGLQSKEIHECPAKPNWQHVTRKRPISLHSQEIVWTSIYWVHPSSLSHGTGVVDIAQ